MLPPADETFSHFPVMRDEALQLLALKDGGTYVDGTFGLGGYTEKMLQAANTNVIAIDRDPAAAQRALKFTAIYGDRFTLIPGNFGDMKHLLAGIGVTAVDGVVLDLGVSSPQLDDAARGFSFREDGPLDMRMDNNTGQSAAQIVNSMAADALANIIYELGEEKRSRRVAAAIVEARQIAPIETTLQLAEIIRKVVPRSKDGIDPATRTFQALRLHVNDELGELERALEAAEDILNPEGRLVVVSFHSLEDRIVKNFMRARSAHSVLPSRHLPSLPGTANDARPSFKVLTRSAMPPSPEECRANPRSRSARLRAAERAAAPITGLSSGLAALATNNLTNQAG